MKIDEYIKKHILVDGEPFANDKQAYAFLLLEVERALGSEEAEKLLAQAIKDKLWITRSYPDEKALDGVEYILTKDKPF